MSRAKVLARFADLHEDVPVEVVDLSDDEDEVADAKARKYRVSGIPAFRVLDDAGKVLVTACGAMDLRGLERLVEKARARS